MSKTHVGFLVVKVLSVGDSFEGRTFTLVDLERLAANSGGSMWVLDQDLLTHQALEGPNKIRLDA